MGLLIFPDDIISVFSIEKSCPPPALKAKGPNSPIYLNL